MNDQERAERQFERAVRRYLAATQPNVGEAGVKAVTNYARHLWIGIQRQIAVSDWPRGRKP